MEFFYFSLTCDSNEITKYKDDADIVFCIAKGKISSNLNERASFTHSRFLLEKSKKFKRNFSCISHKKDLSLIAYADFKIGVDIEYLRARNYQNQVDFCFSKDEKIMLENSKDKLKEFYKIYTTKESLIKFGDKEFCDIDKLGICEQGGYYFKNSKIKFAKISSFCFEDFIFSVAYQG
ncbi:MAG: 4'-phosphopantetheinyl transferase superfamily protein [Campylobacter sp.]|nr:4'-phosphopantetheinyl transferase superfamily protein [Campylobacter sp.]